MAGAFGCAVDGRRASRSWRGLFTALAIVALGACVPFLYDDGCGAERCELAALGRLTAADSVAISYVEVALGEQRPDPPREWLLVLVMGPRGARGGPLRDRVTAARVVDLTDGVVIAPVPVGPAPVFGDEVFGASSAAYTGTLPFAEAKRRLGAGRAVLELTSDVPGYETVRIPLMRQRNTDWSRAQCS